MHITLYSVGNFGGIASDPADRYLSISTSSRNPRTKIFSKNNFQYHYTPMAFDKDIVLRNSCFTAIRKNPYNSKVE